MRTRRGMTLVEVMVVIVIITAIMGVLSIAVLSTASDARMMARELEVRPPQASVTGGLQAVGLDAVSVEIDVSSRPARSGWRVGTAYDVEVDAIHVWRKPQDVTSQTTLYVPLPADAGDLFGVELSVTDAAGIPIPGEIRSGPEGLSFTGPLGQVAHSRVRYATRGRDRLSLAIADGSRPVDLLARIHLDDAPSYWVPGGSLAPTSTSEAGLIWSYDGLLSDAPIAVALRVDDTPLGHLAMVGQLAVLGVLVFCGGFWYLNEGDRPGRLDDFRLGGLLLLALNYGAFYAIFLVVAPRMGEAVAVALAAAGSVPLLFFHVTRITGSTFAWRRALPLAVVCTTAVFAASFADGARTWIGLGLFVGAVAFVTATLRPWLARRGDHVVALAQRDVHRQALVDLDGVFDALVRAQRHADDVMAEAQHVLGQTPEGLAPERGEVQRRQRGVLAAVAPSTGWIAGRQGWAAESTRRVGAHHLEVARTHTAVERSATALAKAVGAFEAARDTVMTDLEAALQRLRAARLRMGRVQIDAVALHGRTSGRVGAQMASCLDEIAVLEGQGSDLVVRAAAPDLDAGGLVVRSQGLIQRMEGVTAHLATATRRAAEASLKADGPLHCPACGEGQPGEGRFCSGCGVSRPVALRCQACDHRIDLPSHLLKADWSRVPLCCGACGAGLRAPSSPPPGADPYRRAETVEASAGALAGSADPAQCSVVVQAST